MTKRKGLIKNMVGKMTGTIVTLKEDVFAQGNKILQKT